MAAVGEAGGAQRNLGGQVKAFRRRAGLTQREAADLAGISIAGLRDVEQGRVDAPRAATMRRLAAALELSQAEAEQLAAAARSEPVHEDTLSIGVLGALVVRVDGADVDPGAARHRLLLGMLALTPNTPVSSDALIEAGWGERPPSTAAGLLQTTVSRLRRRLRSRRADSKQGAVISAVAGGYRLEVGRGELDLLEFRERAAAARLCKRDGDLAGALRWYTESVTLWRGEPLADVPALRIHPAAVALARERAEVVVELATVAAELGKHADVVPLLREVIESDPLHEAAHARLMIALAGTGQQAEAMSVFAELRDRLAADLGTGPGAVVLDAHSRVLRQEIPAGAGAAPVRAHRQLPPDIADFTGRERELTSLRAVVNREGTDARTRILVIEGMAGVGKTRLAVHLAHSLLASGGYDEQQLYVDLHGYSDDPPADVAAVLGSFLQLLGVPGDQVPAGADARARLYRERMAGRRTLVLLDNATSVAQLRPLLPAHREALVLVTSRRSLDLDGAHTLALDVLTPAEAYALLAKVVGRRRVDADLHAARSVIALCGRLPLAVALVARRLQARPAWGFADLAGRLREAGERISELAAGSRRVRAAFDLSYHALDPEAQRVFRLLGTHPGEDFTEASVGALAELDPASARGMLEHLAQEHLVIAASGRRFRLHDLLRDYARELVSRTMDGDGGEALSRVLHWYLHAANAARVSDLNIGRDHIALDCAASSGLPEFTTQADAFRWLDAEKAVLAAVVTVASEHDFPQIAWQLPMVLRGYFDRTSDWDTWIAAGEMGIAAARRIGARQGEARLLLDLSKPYAETGDLDRAASYVREALALFRKLGDRAGQAWALNNLGIALAMKGELRHAQKYIEQALRLGDGLQMQAFEPSTLNNLGRVHAALGQHNEAIECFETSLRRGADRPGGLVVAALTLHSLGESLMAIGQDTRAIEVLREAVELHHTARMGLAEAETLETLGHAFSVIGRMDEARRHWQRAWAVLTQLGHPRAADLFELMNERGNGADARESLGSPVRNP